MPHLISDFLSWYIFLLLSLTHPFPWACLFLATVNKDLIYFSVSLIWDSCTRISAVLPSSLWFSVGWTGSWWWCWAWLWCPLAGRGALEALQQLPRMNHSSAGVSASVLCVKKSLPGQDGWWPSGVSQLAAGMPECGDSWARAALCPSDTEACVLHPALLVSPKCCNLACCSVHVLLFRNPGVLERGR